MATLIDKYKNTLEAAWAQVESNPMQYMQVIATQFIDFASLGEKAFRNIFDRLKVLEAALNIVPAAAPSASKPMNGNGSMVRLDASGDVMSPAEQAVAEQADMTFDGAIDRSRYVPADSVPMTQPTMPPQPPATAMPAPTPTPAPAPQAVPPTTMVSVPKSASMKQ